MLSIAGRMVGVVTGKRGRTGRGHSGQEESIDRSFLLERTNSRSFFARGNALPKMWPQLFLSARGTYLPRTSKYPTGIKSRVTSMLTVKPPITAMASGCCIWAPGPKPQASGKRPRIVARLAGKIGARAGRFPRRLCRLTLTFSHFAKILELIQSIGGGLQGCM
jgi:hypothetical protein